MTLAALRPSRGERSLARALVQRLLLVPVVRWFAPRMVVRGMPPTDGPVVFVANHASHADTAVLLTALGGARLRTRPAAAADYFFRSRARALLTRSVTGAFPFPRRGGLGLARVRAVLAAGESVLLFPEGTRSVDGSIGSFKPGIGRLAAAGVTVIPVGLAGSGSILPKGARVPRRTPVAVVFGAPVRAGGCDPATATARIEAAVRRLAQRARAAVPAPRRTWRARAAAFARRPAALALLFAWGAGEALVVPVVPDVGIVILALAAPARAPALVLAAAAGTVAGGAIAYPIGAAAGPGLLERLPLLTGPMIEAASGWLGEEGARAVWHQPLSGVPFKAFALQAADAGVSAPDLLFESAGARGARFAGAGLTAAALGWFAAPVVRRAYAPLVVLGTAAFAAGLARVVAAWS